MLSKATLQKTAQIRSAITLVKNSQRAFSHGPYNPLHFKGHLVPEELPT